MKKNITATLTIVSSPIVWDAEKAQIVHYTRTVTIQDGKIVLIGPEEKHAIQTAGV